MIPKRRDRLTKDGSGEILPGCEMAGAILS
jgi:hypothetical protein